RLGGPEAHEAGRLPSGFDGPAVEPVLAEGPEPAAPRIEPRRLDEADGEVRGLPSGGGIPEAQAVVARGRHQASVGTEVHVAGLGGGAEGRRLPRASRAQGAEAPRVVQLVDAEGVALQEPEAPAVGREAEPRRLEPHQLAAAPGLPEAARPIP